MSLRNVYERKVIFGTCGWADSTLGNCKKFYPPKTTSSTEKLAYYSRNGGFGTVEVDSSSYAIPSRAAVQGWVESTPKDFKFHFKAFGAFCHGTIDARCLPIGLRGELQGRIDFSSLSESLKKDLWEQMNTAFFPAYEAGKLGCVVFQYQLNFLPSVPAMEHVEYCCRQLSQKYSMAVEFRNREWTDTTHLSGTVRWLRKLRPEGVCLVSCDDLKHEMEQPNNQQTGLPDGQIITHMPIVLTARACSSYAYIRLHRRFGHDRLLSSSELSDWVIRLESLCQELENDTSTELSLKGPIYFLIGTEHDDQPAINARALGDRLPDYLRLDWRALHSGGLRDIRSLFPKKPKCTSDDSPCTRSEMIDESVQDVFIHSNCDISHRTGSFSDQSHRRGRKDSDDTNKKPEVIRKSNKRTISDFFKS